MKYETSIDIDADAQSIWDVMTDVERWPEWTASVVRVERRSSEQFGVGSNVAIKQPRLMKVVWTVTDLEPLVSFTWKSAVPGLTTIASHRLAPGPAGTTTATLWVDQRGALAPVLRLLGSRMTRRYLDYERLGLKARSEAAASNAHQPSTEAAARASCVAENETDSRQIQAIANHSTASHIARPAHSSARPSGGKTRNGAAWIEVIRAEKRRGSLKSRLRLRFLRNDRLPRIARVAWLRSASVSAARTGRTSSTNPR